jgi:hypothetical protein
MDWTFWLLSGCAALAVVCTVWWTLDAYGFLGEGWDDHVREWKDDE